MTAMAHKVCVSIMVSRVERIKVGDDNQCANCYRVVFLEEMRVAVLRAPDAGILLTQHVFLLLLLRYCCGFVFLEFGHFPLAGRNNKFPSI